MNFSKSENLYFIVTTIIFLLVILYVASEYQSEKPETSLTSININSGKCKIQSEICNFDIDDLRISISSDKNIKYLNPFVISVKTKTNNNLKIKKIQVDFKMINMDMGVNRFLLNKKPINNNNEQLWQGKALLPICVTGRADWVAEFSLYIKDSLYFLKLPITVEQPNS